jgi:hypothetical protein
MALISPGVDVTVIDESQYAPAGAGTVPYVLIATAQDKTSGSGSGTAAGTLTANADAVSIVTSQRELVSLYGNPIFKTTASGTPVHGSELNEYGLMAAYSMLGVTNRVYVQRANVDLGQLEGTSVRPTNDPADGTYWLDTQNTVWGLFEWNASTNGFTAVTPIVITDTANLASGIPAVSIGNIGDYAVVATSTSNPVYYKKYDNTWVLAGSLSWQNAHYAVQSPETNPILTAGDELVINGTTVTLTGTTITAITNDINTAAVTGVTARNNDGKLEIFVDATASSDGSSVDGVMSLANGAVGDVLLDLAITAGEFAAPTLQLSSHVSVPRWRGSDTTPRPTGSIWSKTTSANVGANMALSVYSLASTSFLSVSAPLYANDQSALAALDATGGGLNIAAGAVYVQYDVLETGTATYKLFKRSKQGTTTVTGTVANPALTAGNTFTIQASQTGVTALSSVYTITLPSTAASGMVSAILANNIPNVTAAVTAGGAVSITHTKGGVLVLKNSSGTPLSAAGITSSTTNVRAGNDLDLIVSNFAALAYTASDAAPNSDPDNGRMWYWSDVGEVDIMVHDGSGWVGYQNETADARGYNLSATDPAGPIVSASEPTTQSDDTALAYGDLWIDTSDLENFPVIYRYSNVDGAAAWVLLDNTDQTTENGVLFADARWDLDGTSNVVVDDIVSIADLLTSDYIDLDAPDADLYPRGTLLFNTRRSSFNVKKFMKNYFNASDFAGSLPTEKDAWVTAAGLKDDGRPYMGRQSVRKIVSTAMKAAIAASTELREEQRLFTLISAPGYPELIPSMVALNNDRRNTAFVVGDTPMRLSGSATDVQNWANDVNREGTGEFGLATSDPYLAVYYPCGQTNDLSGNTIVVPASHIALRTLIRSDNVSYPWFAAAGVRRGLVDNASSIGYINATTGEFNAIGVTEGLRDTLYESRINPITFLTGVGLCVYGNKSLGVTGSALDRINVSRLVVYLRRIVDLASRNFVFEPNDKITRDEIKQVIERACNDLVAKRAITDYLVVCDESNNTPIRRDRNELYVDVAIEPVKAAEFIYVPIRIKSQGAISGS